MTVDQLRTELFGSGHGDALGETDVAGWLNASRRFRAFVEENLPKVHKKLRTASGPQATRDVLLELEVAYRLSSVKAHGLSYEPFGASGERGPDFAVAFNGRPWFLLEVTRSTSGAGAPAERMGRAVGAKLGQLRPEGPNVVLVGTEGPPPEEDDLAAALAGLAREAESAEPVHFMRLGLRDRRAFFQRYERLSAVMVASFAATPGPVSTWFNQRARRQVATRGLAALVRALGE